MLEEALQADWPIEAIVFNEVSPNIPEIPPPFPVFHTTDADFHRLSTQVNPEGVLTYVRIPAEKMQQAPSQLPLGPGFLVEGVQDPGNLGTLLRTADWMGMSTLVLGPGTVDHWNPKVLRASMGAIFRLEIFRVEEGWESYLGQQQQTIWVADMSGTPLPEAPMHATDWLLLGNEANGVSALTRTIPSLKPVHIPRRGGGESLNVGVAAGILAWKLLSG